MGGKEAQARGTPYRLRAPLPLLVLSTVPHGAELRDMRCAAELSYNRGLHELPIRGKRTNSFKTAQCSSSTYCKILYSSTKYVESRTGQDSAVQCSTVQYSVSIACELKRRKSRPGPKV